jgi:hypothetical protein
MQLTDFDNIVINESQRPEVLMIIENGQVNEVNLKKMMATLGIAGALFTSGIVQGYDYNDFNKMGFSKQESEKLEQMADENPQQAADIVNQTIQNMRQMGDKGAKQVYGGDTLLFPQTSADTIKTDKPTNIGKYIGSQDDPQSSYNRGNRNAQDPFGLTPDKGTGNPEKMKKNARLLNDVVNADRSISKYVEQVYYSTTLNKIVIIPNYPDLGRMAGIKGSNALGNSVIDNIARRILLPKITGAVVKVGVPGLDMDNVVIVDRSSRAPR